MLAVLTDERFSDERWLFERKLDGIRCLAFRADKRLRLLSRNREEQDNTYPELVDPLLHQSVTNFVVDGEVIAFDGKRTSFSRLQQRSGIKNAEAARRSGVRVYYYMFDVLHLEGFDTTALALRDHRRQLHPLHERAFRFFS